MYSVAAVRVLNPVNMCDVKHTPKYSIPGADGKIAQQTRRVDALCMLRSVILRGTIVNRTYGIHEKKNYTFNHFY